MQLKEGGDELDDEEEDKPARIAGLAVVLDGKYSGSLAGMVKSSNAASPAGDTNGF